MELEGGAGCGVYRVFVGAGEGGEGAEVFVGVGKEGEDGKILALSLFT